MPDSPNPVRDLLMLVMEHQIPTQCLLAVEELEGSGIPGPVIEQYASDGVLPLFFHPGYFLPDRHMRVTFTDTHVALYLSFDGLYACRLPWSAFRFLGHHVEGYAKALVEPPAPAPAPAPRPGLRLVDEGDG